MPDVPHYFLYGETSPPEALDFLFIVALEESLPKHNWEIHPHRHAGMHQLLIVEQGQVDVQLREMASRVAGPCILSIPPREVHAFSHDRGVRGYIVTIADAYLHGLFSETERQKFPSILSEPMIVDFDPDAKTASDFDILVGQILREYRDRRDGHSAVIGALLKVLLIVMLRVADVRVQRARHNDPRIRYFEEFRELLERRFVEHLTVQQYAEALGLTTGRLNRLCQRYAGQNAMQVIHERVVAEAKRRLIFVDASMNEIAYDLGFKDPAYFSRFFNKHCGEPPGKYRARLRDEADA